VNFRQVDVFTAKPFLGNPVAVVIGADELDAQTMQRIACWTNLSETTFLLKSSKADYRLRIFTPRQELPFAGHPTIGSAHAALESGFVGSKKKLLQECGAGLIELSIEEDGRIFLKGPTAKGERMERQIPSIPLAPASAVMKIDVGPVWVVAQVSDAAALVALKPDMTALAEWSDGVCTFRRLALQDPRTLVCAGTRHSGGPGVRQRQLERRRLLKADGSAVPVWRRIRCSPGNADGARRQGLGSNSPGFHRNRRPGSHLC
jgi:predicted PhzF superfamily epimerase YddE/YHI9